MRNTTAIGDVSTAKILAALVAAGETVLLPFSAASRYDLVLDRGAHFYRVQCKTSRLKDGYLVFRTSSVHKSRGKIVQRTYSTDVDFFGVYCPELDRVYLIPIDDVPNIATIRFRVEGLPHPNGKPIRLATTYEV